MDIIERILEQATAGGLSRVITYVLMIPVGALVVWGIYKFAQWRLRLYKERKIAALKKMPKEALHASAKAAITIGEKGTAAARATVKNAAPIIRQAGDIVRDGTIAAAEATKPYAQAAAAQAYDAAKLGADVAAEGVKKAAPIARNAAFVAVDTAKHGANKAFGLMQPRIQGLLRRFRSKDQDSNPQ